MNNHIIYAHTKKNVPESDWELLWGQNGHAEKVRKRILSFTSPFKKEFIDISNQLLEILALYHDMGKASKGFQLYLRGKGEQVDHKTEAAKWIVKKWGSIYGQMLAYAFKGHHTGLPNGIHLFNNSINDDNNEETLQAIPQEFLDIPVEPKVRIVGEKSKVQDECVFSWIMAIRMLHSCLVDADWLATEEYMDASEANKRASCVYKSIVEMSMILETFIELKEKSSKGQINELRKEIHKACFGAGGNQQGVYQLNVPTGGGKTLASLSFALNHAKSHGMDRIIYVIPYTTIIEQTASQFRDILGADSVVEHHSNLAEQNDTEKNRFASDNWDAPLIVTTNVQFFESLFARNPKKCRKLHNIANSVIILDEVQTLPTSYLKPCLYALKSLQRDFGCTIVLCTATQPLVINKDNFSIGWEENEVHSLIGKGLEIKLQSEMRRVEVVNLNSLSTESLVNHYFEQGEQSVLFIVNLTSQAHRLVDYLEQNNVDNVYHLSGRMCPSHRLEVLKEVLQRLEKGNPTVLVATRVVEAGVDISFPVVYRDICGLDSLAQSAGRCNRHGECKSLGRVYLYEDEEFKIPSSFTDLRDGIYTMKDLLIMEEKLDLNSQCVVDKYFARFYRKREQGCPNWDKEGIIYSPTNFKGIEFENMTKKFKMIDSSQISLVVPYGELFEELRVDCLRRDKLGIMPTREQFRQFSALSVNIFSSEWEKLKSHCECLHQEAGIWALCRNELYDDGKGLLRETVNYIF